MNKHQNETWPELRRNLHEASRHLRESPNEVALPAAASWIANTLYSCDPLCDALTDDDVRKLREALRRRGK